MKERSNVKEKKKLKRKEILPEVDYLLALHKKDIKKKTKK